MRISKNKTFNKAFLFMLAVCMLYLAFWFSNPEMIEVALKETVIVFLKIIPILILVFFVMFAMNTWVKADVVKKHLGGESGVRGWIYSILAGILISGPPYILYPLFGDLQKKGMKNSLIAVVLYNRNVKLPFVPVMIYYFGLPFTVVVSVLIIILSIPNGLLVNYLSKK